MRGPTDMWSRKPAAERPVSGGLVGFTHGGFFLSDLVRDRQVHRIMRTSRDPAASASESEDDAALLERFAAIGDDDAFAELARRYSGLIYSIAWRRGGSPELAQEATQNVLAALARKAARLDGTRQLTPWLHRAAVLETSALLRREARYRNALRRRQEDTATAMPDPAFSETAAAWASVRPLVDEELDALSERDREVLLWHHVEGRTFRDIAARLGVTAEAAQRRGHRALEKLAARLRRRGVTVPALVLGGALTTGLASEVAAASSTLATTALAHSRTLATAARTGSAGPVSSWVASPAALVAAGVLSAGLPVWWQARATTRQSARADTALSMQETAARVASSSEHASLALAAETKLDYLRQALDQLGKTPADAAPTKLGLQLRQYMLALNAEELPGVGRLLREAPRSHPGVFQVIAAFSTRLAELNPSLALELAQATDGGHPDADYARSVDKESLLEVITRNHKAEFLRAAQADKQFGFDALRVWAAHDAVGAIEYVRASQEGWKKLAGYSNCFQQWFMDDPTAALHWLDAHAVDQPEAMERAHHSFIDGLGNWLPSQLPPTQAVALTASIEDPLLRNKVIEGVFAQYRRRHPEALVGLAPFWRLEEGGKPLSVAEVVAAWREKDEAGLTTWVDSLPEGDLKTTARRHLATPAPSHDDQP